MKTVSVVAAVIHEGRRVFATQRGYGEFKDGWEFPGGKIEPGETPEGALIREIREELAADIDIERFLVNVEYDYPSFHLSMQVFLCRLNKPRLELREHESARWVSLPELDGLAFLPPDRLVVEALKKAL